jgi:hypothetical protein
MLSHGDAATSGYMTRVHVQKGEGVPGYRGNTEVHQNHDVMRDVIISDQIQLRHLDLYTAPVIFLARGGTN